MKVNGVENKNSIYLSDPSDPLCDTIDLFDTSEYMNMTFEIIQKIRGGFEIQNSVELRIPCDSDNILKPSINEPVIL